MKWRLLEGGGQAFYELGVADEGALVGLTPLDLADTLDTLYAMAKEIGAKVVVVKEIEVTGNKGREGRSAKEFVRKGGRDKERKERKERDRRAKEEKLRIVSAGQPASLTPSSFGSTASFATTNDSDLELPDLTRLSATPSPPTVALSTPADAELESVPVIKVDLDDSLALFSMDPEPNLLDDDDALQLPPVSKPLVPPTRTQRFTIDLESPNARAIACIPSPPLTATPAGAMSLSPTFMSPLSALTSPLTFAANATASRNAVTPAMTKAQKRRVARDLRRSLRKRALEDPIVNPNPVEHDSVSLGAQAAESVEIVMTAEDVVPAIDLEASHAPGDELAEILEGMKLEANGKAEASAPVDMVPRLIVEAMVVRELDLDEAFLDFTRV